VLPLFLYTLLYVTFPVIGLYYVYIFSWITAYIYTPFAATLHCHSVFITFDIVPITAILPRLTTPSHNLLPLMAALYLATCTYRYRHHATPFRPHTTFYAHLHHFTRTGVPMTIPRRAAAHALVTLTYGSFYKRTTHTVWFTYTYRAHACCVHRARTHTTTARYRALLRALRHTRTPRTLPWIVQHCRRARFCAPHRLPLQFYTVPHPGFPLRWF